MINLFDSNPVNGHSFMNDLKKEFDKTMKQTAVEWLVDQIENFNCMKLSLIPSDIIEKAKQIEKEQIEESFISGEHQQGFEGEAEQYYKENYGEK